ncbi:cytochrome P450 [Piscinibacter sp.]|uniref:cytochrome P450 n=1 Tax=Piscinibacter sp. TaxID=1903157 RepID=UPI002C9B6831|nr:cytochrome P450 [Albitalea sp.]HUG23996.1 cytochrome P450 [Albitalea sp.]
MKQDDAAALLRFYAGLYMLVCVAVSSVCALLVGQAVSLQFTAQSFVSVLVAGALALLLMVAIASRLREFRRLRHIPGPSPTFFLGNLRSLLVHEHGARDKALVELHRIYGPVLKLHMAWGSRPFVSVAEVPKAIRQKSVDSNRHADGTVLPNSLMGLKLGDKHQAHRQQINPHFTPKALTQSMGRSLDLSSTYLDAWRSGLLRRGSLKSDVHHWSADSLGLFLCGEDWTEGQDLSSYLEAIATLEEAISFRAFHPFFVRWTFARQSARAKRAYRYLFDFLEAALQRRLASSDRGEAPQDILGRLALLHRDSHRTAMPWTHEDCVEELISLVAGGTDAMSYTVAQSLVLLSRHPDVQQAAYDHVRLEDDDPGTPLNPFMLNIVRETMRLFPAVPFSSKVSDDAMDVVGLSVPARTNVMWMKTAVGQNSTLFRDPQRFAPDRFTPNPITGRPAESLSSALPFGAGMRHCVGQHLAEELCTRFLTAIVRQFSLAVLPDVDVQYVATVSVAPSIVPVVLNPRPLPCGSPFGRQPLQQHDVLA